jgi:hypothetical protein
LAFSVSSWGSKVTKRFTSRVSFASVSRVVVRVGHKTSSSTVLTLDCGENRGVMWVGTAQFECLTLITAFYVSKSLEVFTRSRCECVSWRSNAHTFRWSIMALEPRIQRNHLYHCWQSHSIRNSLVVSELHSSTFN